MVTTLIKPETTEEKSVKGWFRGRSSRLWLGAFYGVLMFSLSFGLASLLRLTDDLAEASNTHMKDVEWMVLVKGTQLEIDDVGRYLKQLPDADQVTYISSAEAFNRLKNEQLVFEDLSAFEPNDLPPSWLVSWRAEALDLNHMQDLITDTRRIPGVLDVAFDSRSVQVNVTLRRYWYELRLIAAVLMIGALLFSTALIGRFLFFTPGLRLNGAKFLNTVLLTEIVWALGWALVYKTLGPPRLIFLPAGLLAGAVLYCWMSYERR